MNKKLLLVVGVIPVALSVLPITITYASCILPKGYTVQDMLEGKTYKAKNEDYKVVNGQIILNNVKSVTCPGGAVIHASNLFVTKADYVVKIGAGSGATERKNLAEFEQKYPVLFNEIEKFGSFDRKDGTQYWRPQTGSYAGCTFYLDQSMVRMIKK